MADENKGGGGGAGGGGFGIFIVFFGAIFALWLISGGGKDGGIFGNATSSFFGTYSTSTQESVIQSDIDQIETRYVAP